MVYFYFVFGDVVVEVFIEVEGVGVGCKYFKFDGIKVVFVGVIFYVFYEL